MKKILLNTIILLTIVNMVLAVDIASDGFESNSLSGGLGWSNDWEVTGQAYPWYSPHTGTFGLFINGQASVSREVDLSSYINNKLSFWINIVSAPQTISYIVDGIETNLITLDSGSSYTYYEFDLPSDVVTIKFSNDGHASTSNIDDILITGDVGVLSEVSLAIDNNYVVGKEDSVISIDSTETDTIHTVKLSDSDNNIFCEQNIVSPNVAHTLFNVVCDMPSYPIVDAKAYVQVTNDDSINDTKYFNIIDLIINPNEIDIQQVYFSPQVLQGGSTEIFAIIKTVNELDYVNIEINYPDGNKRLLSMSPTTNLNEYKAFITDTFQTGNITFQISAKSGEYYDTYNNKYKVAPYNIDFVQLVNQVGEVLNVKTVEKVLEPSIDVHGTEYRALDPGRMFIQLLDGYNAPITDSHCYLSIYYPDNSPTPFRYKQQMTYADEGLYYYDFIVPYMNGVYMASSYCVLEDTLFDEVNAFDDFEGGSIIDNFDTAVETNWIEESPLTVEYITWDIFEGTGSMRVQAGSGSDGKKVTRTFATPENYSGAVKFSYYLKGSTTANEWALQLVDSDGNILQSTDAVPQTSFTKVNIYVDDMIQVNGTFNLEEVEKISFVADYTGSYADNKFDLLQWSDESDWVDEWTLNGAVISTAQAYSGDYSLLQANDDDPTRSVYSNTNYTSVTVSFYHRTENMELNEFYYVYVEDASGTDYLLLSVTDGDDDGVWKFTSQTFDAVTDSFDFNGTLRFYIDSSGNTENDDLLYIDEVNLEFSELILVNETEYQVVRGSGEIHVTSDNSFIAELTQGELYYDNFYEGFRQYYDIISQVYVDTQEVEVTVPIYEPFPCDHVLNVQIYNETTDEWENISEVWFEYNNNGRNRCNLMFNMNLETFETYQIRTDSENYWKQKILGDYQDNILLNDLMEIGCINYQQANGFDNYTVPIFNQSYSNDSLYLSCLSFFNAFYHYSDEISSSFLPLISIETNFTKNQMNFLEASFTHIEEAGHEVRQYGTTIVNGLNLGNSYSLAIISDPYPPVNPLWATYFSNISSNTLIYGAQQLQYLDILSKINLSVNESYISESVWQYPTRNLTYYAPASVDTEAVAENVWNYTVRNLTYYEPTPVDVSSIWEYTNRTLTNATNIAPDIWGGNYTIDTGMLGQIVESIWNYIARYTHGEVQ